MNYPFKGGGSLQKTMFDHIRQSTNHMFSHWYLKYSMEVEVKEIYCMVQKPIGASDFFG